MFVAVLVAVMEVMNRLYKFVFSNIEGGQTDLPQHCMRTVKRILTKAMVF